MALGFITLAVLEVLLLLSATGNLQEPIVPMVNVQLPMVIFSYDNSVWFRNIEGELVLHDITVPVL